MVRARCFAEWEGLIAERLSADGWPERSAAEMASAALALIEGALLLARVSGQLSHLDHAESVASTILAAPPAETGLDGRVGLGSRWAARDSNPEPAG